MLLGEYVNMNRGTIDNSFYKKIVDGGDVYYELKYFTKLLSRGNMRCLEGLWAPEDCVTHTTKAAEAFIHVRENFITRSFFEDKLKTLQYGFDKFKALMDFADENTQLKTVLDFADVYNFDSTINRWQKYSYYDFLNHSNSLYTTPVEEFFGIAKMGAPDMYTLYYDFNSAIEKSDVRREDSRCCYGILKPNSLDDLIILQNVPKHAINMRGILKIDWKSWYKYKDEASALALEADVLTLSNQVYDPDKLTELWKDLKNVIELSNSKTMVLPFDAAGRAELRAISRCQTKFEHLLIAAGVILNVIEKNASLLKLKEDVEPAYLHELIVSIRQMQWAFTKKEKEAKEVY
jgi:hypothetical protein